MVKYSDQQLNKTFRALADTTRRQILARLTQGDVLVTDLAKPFDMSLPAISKHLRVLENAGLISKQKQGRIRLCHLEPQAFDEVANWLEFYQQFWDIRLDRLSHYFEEVSTTENKDLESKTTKKTKNRK